MKKYFYVLAATALISCGASDKKAETAQTAEGETAKVETVETKAETKAEPKAPIDKGTVKATSDKEEVEIKKPVVDGKKIDASATKIKAEMKESATKS